MVCSERGICGVRLLAVMLTSYVTLEKSLNFLRLTFLSEKWIVRAPREEVKSERKTLASVSTHIGQ